MSAAQILPDHPGPQAEGRLSPRAGNLRAAYALSAATGVLMAVQSATGMLFFGLYRDQQFALGAWRVNDPVKFFVAVPLVFASLALAVRANCGVEQDRR